MLIGGHLDSWDLGTGAIDDGAGVAITAAAAHLIAGERTSRFIHYSANYSTMDELIAFLTSNCCQGSECLPKTACCDTTEKRRATAGKEL